jgi:hypothetical protein
MSYDGVNQPEPLAITAAGAALLISGGWHRVHCTGESNVNVTSQESKKLLNDSAV